MRGCARWARPSARGTPCGPVLARRPPPLSGSLPGHVSLAGPRAHHAPDPDLRWAESLGSESCPGAPAEPCGHGTLQTRVEEGSLGPTETQTHTGPGRGSRASLRAAWGPQSFQKRPRVAGHAGAQCEVTGAAPGSTAARVPVLPAVCRHSHHSPHNSPGNWEAIQAAGLRWGINNLQILKKKKIGAIFTPKMLSTEMQSV